MTILKALLTYPKVLLLTISLLLMVNLANASNQLTAPLKMVGQGEMSWLFINLYHASFYSQSGEYQEQVYPQALKIVYQQDIDKEDLVSATEKEWRKLSLNNKQYQNWLTELTQLWPDIKKGDQLLFRVEADGRGLFYHNNQLLGGINSDQFSAAFLSIWLSKNSSEPKLRKQLLGE
ncbi:MAG: hypothetical protein ACJAT7_000437 [Psychromonas sp.]|jgi:hypothetical protein|uniref:chalcone isomerase family protein n=1 Tax=Psychromonas sp. TaxID=1884585 RepID=UPI0039E21453